MSEVRIVLPEVLEPKILGLREGLNFFNHIPLNPLCAGRASQWTLIGPVLSEVHLIQKSVKVYNSIGFVSTFRGKLGLQLGQKIIVKSSPLNAVKEDSDHSCWILPVINVNDV